MSLEGLQKMLYAAGKKVSSRTECSVIGERQTAAKLA
jgi:hypothetical protein